MLRALAVLGVFCTLSALGCDKIAGLIKKDGAGEGGVAGGAGGAGGVAPRALSFLGGAFEGEITVKVSGSGRGGPTEMVFGIKRPKVRIDATGGPPGNPALSQGGAFIIDPPAKKGYALMPAQKKAMLIDFDKVKAGTSGLPGSKTAPGALTEVPTIVKTGQTEVIAGYECENWKITSKSSRADMCVAEGIKWIDLTDLGMGSPEVALAAVAADANRFPLRTIAYDATGAETTRMEATKIEQKVLDASRFVVPPDYQIIDMSALLGGMGQIPGGGKLPPGLPPGFVPPKPK